jgi:hypothetical protein
MTTPGVGPVVALTYRATVDVPARFHKSKAIGAVFGLTCSKSQSGEIDRSGRITGCSARGLSAVGEGAALTDIAFEPVSSNRSLRCGEMEFSGQRQRGRNGLGVSRTPVQDKISPGDSANSGLIAGFREISVRTRMRGGPGRTRTSQLNQSLAEKWDTKSFHSILRFLSRVSHQIPHQTTLFLHLRCQTFFAPRFHYQP